MGLLLHQDVNMYSTAGLSTMWSQSASEWNGTGPHAGMQATMFRSHAREEMAAAENGLAQATTLFQQGFPKNGEVLGLLLRAVVAHDAGLRQYDSWDYRGVLNSAEQSLSLTSQAFRLMGQADKIYDPLQINAVAQGSSFHPSIDSAQIEKALKSLTVEHSNECPLTAASKPLRTTLGGFRIVLEVVVAGLKIFLTAANQTCAG